MAPFKPSILAAALVAAGSIHAQTTLKPVVITERSSPTADVTGFGDLPLRELPVSASVVTRQQIDEAGARRLADLTRFDASVNDAYNAPGYWDFLAIRGFTLDNRFNYRREGLPISAETIIPLDNKERVEILKGTSGIQAGTSAPGGVVNYVVKRPTMNELRHARLEFTQRASLLAAADLGGRAGTGQTIGWRLNVAHERLRPLVRKLDGQRSLVALATDWRIGSDSMLEGEFEWSRHAQPSMTGLSLLGSALPPVTDPRLNLNNQPWAQASRFENFTGTLRYTQALGSDWSWSAQLGTQNLKTDDFTAFPFGCGMEGNYDRFCSDGTFDYYDFRSENERRRLQAAQLRLAGRIATGGVTHDVSMGLLGSRTRNRFQPQAFNLSVDGSGNPVPGNINGTAIVPPAPALTTVVPDRSDESTELFAQVATQWSDRLGTWLGVRHTRIDRGYRQNLTTPWAAITYKVGQSAMAYASWGQGVESHQVTMNPVYGLANAGEVLPSAKSRQVEVGLRGGDASAGWQFAAFRIARPVTNFDYCLRTFACIAGEYDGRAVHQGLEAAGNWSGGPWQVSAGVMLLHAQRENSIHEPAVNGRRPANVPDHTLRATVGYRVPEISGLKIVGHLSHEGPRSVLADESVRLSSWTRLDASLHYDTRIGSAQTSWSLGIQNLLGRKSWKESPFQFGHVYLYPSAPRTVRLSFTASL